MAYSKNRRLAGIIADVSGNLSVEGLVVPTQSSSDNDTSAASTAYVTTAVANLETGLIDSAPGTLNTLNEIAAALNDDANFNTTVTNSIAAKLPLAGGTMTGSLAITAHDAKITITDNTSSTRAWSIGVGGSTDNAFEIKDVTGSNTLLKSTPGAKTVIRPDGNELHLDSSNGNWFKAFESGSDLYIQNKIQDGDIFIGGMDGSSAITALSFDMGNGGGATFANDVYLADSRKIAFGGADDFSIYHDGNVTNILRASSTNHDIEFLVNDDGTANVSALKLDASNAGAATFNGSIIIAKNSRVLEIADAAIQWYSAETSDYKSALFRADDYSFKNAGNTVVSTIGSTGSASFSDYVAINNSSPELYFGTTGNHYNWRVAAQENIDAGFTIDVGSQDTNYGNDSYSTLFTVKNTGKVGIGETDPKGWLHIKEGDSGLSGSVNSNFDQLVLEDDSHCGMTILSSTGGDGGIYFGDSGGNNRGQFKYQHGSDQFGFITADGNYNLKISASAVTIGSDAATTAISGEVLRLNSCGDNTPLISMTQGNARLAYISNYYSNAAGSNMGFAPPNGATNRTSNVQLKIHGDGHIKSRCDNGNYYEWFTPVASNAMFAFGGVSPTATNGTGNIHSMHMVQSGKITWGDWTDANALGMCEGSWNQEGTDRDYLSIHFRNSMNWYGNSNGQTLSMATGGGMSIKGSLTQNQFSDMRLKRDIVPLESVLDKVNSLDVFNFNYMDPDTGEIDTERNRDAGQIGLSAQQTEELFPQVVEDRERIEGDNTVDNRNWKYLEYEKMTPILVKALQEQQTIIEDLKSRLDEAGL